ncbi:MAG: c-type cytochrome, partial [Verrucomicrobiales bacterium]
RRERRYNSRVLKASFGPNLTLAVLGLTALGACGGGGREAKGPYDTDPTEPAEIQAVAPPAISAVGGRRAEVGEVLLEGWEGYSGELRSQVVQLLLARVERLEALFDAIESGLVQPYQIGGTRREMLLAHTDPEIKARAAELFAAEGSRDEVLKRYGEVLALEGDPAKGETVYESVCIACHKFREKGIIDLAPNLAVVAGWESERILTNILDPNREVAPEYMTYIVETKSGTVLTGRVLAESASGITLNLADNSTRDIARGEIGKLQNSGRSLMPDGLEAAIAPQAMADLIAFLKGGP